MQTLQTTSFKEKISSLGIQLRKKKVEILQVNLGKLCNMTCTHCHVDAGPWKTEENMDRSTADAVVRLMDRLPITTLDLTGGAPEINPNFRYLVREAKKRNIHIIDRCNLTVLFEPGQEDLPDFFATHNIEVVASLPCYSEKNVDKQRGIGTFGKSIDALLILNDYGYGKPGSGRELNLVYNPVGPHLPSSQEELEKNYKKQLWNDFGIRFNKLYTITNMPITRYKKYLKAKNQLSAYLDLLTRGFNPQTVEDLMCRNTLSVSWNGRLYDCDFNQMLGMQIRNGTPLTIHNATESQLENLEILIADHCYGCTAGCGSSCQGALK